MVQLLVLLFAVAGVVAQYFTLYPEYSYVVKDDTFQLNCSSSEPNTSVQTFKWSIPKQQTQAYVIVNGCNATGLFGDKTSYKITCTDTWSSVVFQNITRNQTGIYWQCNSLQQQQSHSNHAHVLYKVPVKSVEMESHTDGRAIAENTSTIFRCQTTESLPAPRIFWFLVSSGFQQINITQAANQTPSAGGGINATTVKSDLSYMFNRSFNGWYIFCMATNTRGQNVTSSETVLNIFFPPDGPPTLTGTHSNRIYRTVEFQQGKLSCTITGGNPLANLTWLCFDKNNSVIVENETVTSSVSWTVDRYQHNKACVCLAEHMIWKSNVSVTVKVLYTPDTPTFKIGNTTVSTVISVIQNNSLSVICESDGNPDTNYEWVNETDGQTLNLTSVQMQDSRPYVCKVTNTMNGTDEELSRSNHSIITVQPLYPPNLPRFTYVDNVTDEVIKGHSINVVKGDIFTLYCRSSGRPQPDYRWENGGDNNRSDINATESLNKTCEATNVMTETVGETRNGTSSASLSVTVLYPPEVLSIHLYVSENILNVSETLTIVERGSLKLICESIGRPHPDYKWNVNNTIISLNSSLEKVNVSRHEIGIYTCNAFNTMNRTFGDLGRGSNNISIDVNILYPAVVGHIDNITITEGSEINITCPVIPGNPSDAHVAWTKEGAVESSNSILLYKQNVARDDEGIYICSVNTTMRPSHGKTEWEVNNGQLRINVVYEAVVVQFHAEGLTNETTIIVNETEDVTFLCHIDSDPPPNANLSHNKNIVQNFDSNVLNYTKKNMTCNDFGAYMCSGMNDYNNGTASFKTLAIYVNCSPRPSKDVTERVASARNIQATLSFAATAYPEPGPIGFHWYFLNGSQSMLSLHNSSFLMVSSSTLESNLTIRNVTKSNYGDYLLRIENTIGDFEQSYTIEPHDVPESPIILNWTSTQSQIIITIEAGFDGGYDQWFNLWVYEDTTENWFIESKADRKSNVFNHTIFGLSPGRTYRVVVVAENFLGNSTEVSVLLETKVLEQMHVLTKNGPQHTVGHIVGIVCGVVTVIVVSVLVGIYLYRKGNDNDDGKLLYQNVPFSGTRQRKIRKTECANIKETPIDNLQEEVDDATAVNKKRPEYNPDDLIEKMDSIKISELFSYVLEKCEDSFSIDYQKLPNGLAMPCTFARKPENIALNRYKGIYPYDHSRVKLNCDPDFFINACYIDGYNRSNAYIASLGPTAVTTNGFKTFWQMVWFKKSDIIVMLTSLREPSGPKCERYWPETGAKELYGDISVSSKKVEEFAEYTIKTFTLLKDGEYRNLTHLHYTAWPDKKVPEDTMSLLEFRQRIKATCTSSDGPIIVHCSAGIGRTGTLIAIDRLIEEGQSEGAVNIFECVRRMREQRTKMVQTLEQYIYIHKVLADALAFDCGAIPAENIQEYMDSTSNSIYRKQYQQLRQTVDKENKEDSEASSDNERLISHNRRGTDVPTNRFRVLLYLSRESGDSDYINAVYINSFKKKDYFIIAQSPLPNTVADFVCMIYQEECTCIVTMEDLKEPGMTVGEYLAMENQTTTFGSFTVSCTRLETKHHCIIRKVNINFTGKYDSGEKTLYHFQYTKWVAGHDTPVNAKEFVQFVNEVEEYATQFGEDRSHVLVHCLKANERSGIFCAVTTLMEKMKYERQVNVLNTLRHLRTRRRTAITSMEQLIFCYQAVCVYTEMFQP